MRRKRLISRLGLILMSIVACCIGVALGAAAIIGLLQISAKL